MAPIMWETLITDLAEFNGRSLVTLLDPNSRILPHVRNLYICGPWGDDLDDGLRLLITALPCDRLRGIYCGDEMPNSTFQQLLPSQRKLGSIYVETEITILGQASNSNFLSPNFRAWSASRMAGVKHTKLSFGLRNGNAKETFENLRKALSAYRDLKDLILDHNGNYTKSLEDILSYATEGQLFGNLTTMTLTSLRLAQEGSQPFRHNLDVTKLQHLRLMNCHSMVSFLESLANSYTEMSGILKQLSTTLLDEASEPVETVSSVERLLKSCPKLEHLLLLLADCNLVNKDCLLSHADTLHSLIIGTLSTEQPLYFSRHDLGIILKACTKVKWLAINFPPVDLGPIIELGHKFRLNGSEENLAVLEGLPAELSGHSTLHTLHMLNPSRMKSADSLSHHRDPLKWNGSFVTSRNTTMQNFANQIVRYMAQQGTAPKIFDVEAITVYPYPSFGLGREPSSQSYHTYTGGYIRDGLGMDVAVAVPVGNALRKLPDDFILRISTT